MSLGYYIEEIFCAVSEGSRGMQRKCRKSKILAKFKVGMVIIWIALIVFHIWLLRAAFTYYGPNILMDLGGLIISVVDILMSVYSEKKKLFGKCWHYATDGVTPTTVY